MIFNFFDLKNVSKLVLAFSFLGAVTGCSTNTCKPEDRVSHQKKSENTVNPLNREVSEAAMKKIKVYKENGSLQCQSDTGTKLDVMAKELTGLKIFSQESKSDGLLRIQMCGKPTGLCNVYEILESDLAAALKLGFKKWKNQ